MAINDPLKGAENIVQLPSARRANPGAATRAQPAPPVLFESWVAARDRAAATLLGGAKRLLLTGPAGTGKTVLIEHVARVLRAAGRAVIIKLADADPAPPAAGETLFVDEADRLSAAKLQNLLKDAAGTVVLIGLESLVRRVATGTVHLKLEPLGQRGAQEYIAQWLRLNGRTPAELDGKAVRALFELSGGVPRLLSTLLAAGAWLAKSSEASVIDAVHIQEAAELRSVLGPPSPPDSAADPTTPAGGGRVVWSVLLAGVVLTGTAVAIAPRLFPAEVERAIAQAGPLVEQVERWLRGEPSTPPRRSSPAAPALVEAAPPPDVPPPITVAPIEAPHVEAAPAEPVSVMPAEVEPPKAAPEAAAERVPEPMQTAQEPPPIIEPPAVRQPEVPPTPVKQPVASPSSALPIGTIELLLRRGREMLAIDDLSAARLLFQRAAEGGSAEAMFDLGQTYEPAFRSRIAAPGLTDRAEALRWYRRAAENGHQEAGRLLPPH